MSERKPAEVFHVVEYINEELDARGWTRRDLAKRMGGDPRRFQIALELLEIQDPDVIMGDEVVEGIAKAFGTSTDVWLNMERTWRETVTSSQGR